jgi:hypothetical protein
VQADACRKAMMDCCYGNHMEREEQKRGWVTQPYLYYKPRQVFEILEDQRKMGHEAWAEGKTLDEMTLKPK